MLLKIILFPEVLWELAARLSHLLFDEGRMSLGCVFMNVYLKLYTKPSGQQSAPVTVFVTGFSGDNPYPMKIPGPRKSERISHFVSQCRGRKRRERERDREGQRGKEREEEEER
jgi:hypothetical protein